MATLPSIDSPKTRLLAGCLLTGASLILAGCAGKDAADKEGAGRAPAPVALAAALAGPQSLTLSGLGHVQGFDTASVRAQTSGKLIAINFTEGQTVHIGQALARIDPRPLQATLAQDEATLARDRAAQANAVDSLARSAPLVAQGLASAQQVEGYRSQAAQFAATVAGDRAAIERDRLTLAYTMIRAPISGVIGVRQIDAGNLVSPTDANGIAVIAQVQPITVLFTLPQSAIIDVRAAMAKAGTTGLAVDALAQGSGRVLDRGRLTVIDNRIDDASGTVTLKAVFPNAVRMLWPGELITARVTLGQLASAITVPASALQSGPGGAYVWIVGNDGRAAMRPVTSGPRVGDRVVITHGLRGGERVVTDGQFGLTPGAPVTALQGGSPPRPLKMDDPERLGLQS
ncbi:MAG: efflux RND transporter periplasmic adaptor subunit [Sphingomonadales bacterium]|nr:efflux RND transporter periplasmic adaptor subunit [Sphingomonadales bacterium]MDE2168512.1 efflux RND transporter periplasmic adaptor subunit [Sphingomonadales bacterium]